MKKAAVLLALVAIMATPLTAFANGAPIIDVTYRFISVDSGEFGGYWAYDDITTHVQVFDNGNGSYLVNFTDSGTFTSWAGISPGNTGTIGDGVTGKIVGGISYTVWGDPKEGLSGFLGTFDFGCDHNANCPNYVSWRNILFDSVSKFTYGSWGWTYTTCGNGMWINADTGNFGDITGDPVPCPSTGGMRRVVRNLWAYVNPGAPDAISRGNICYILSLTQPTQSEEDNDVRRLCFTESAPDWWDGAVFLDYGDVFDNGTAWGLWEGDASAMAFSGAKRLPLYSPDGNDLRHRAKMFSWTQGD